MESIAKYALISVFLFLVFCTVGLAAERPDIIWQLGGHTARINDVAVSPDGLLAASASDDGTLKVWEVEGGRLVLTVTFPEENFSSPFGMYGVSFSPGGDSIWGTSVGGGYRWRLSDGELLDSIIAMESAGQVFFSRDGQYLGLAGSPSGSEDTTNVYRRSDGVLLRSFEPAGSTAAVFSADGQYIIGGNSVGFGGVPGVIRYYRMSDGGLERTIDAHADRVNWLALSPDGTMLASCSDDHLVKLWNADDGSFIRTLTGHTHFVYRVRFSPDGTRLASSSFDGTIRIWNPATGALVHTLTPTGNGLGGMDWRADGLSLVAASNAQFSEPQLSLVEVNAASGAVVRQFLASQFQIVDIALSLDGTRLGVGSYLGGVQMRNVADGSLVWSNPALPIGNQIAFSADGLRLAEGGSDGNVRMIDVVDGSVDQTVPAHGTSFGGIGDVAMSPDGLSMVTRKFGENGKIWNMPALTLRAQLPATNQNAATSMFTPDGQAIASAGPNVIVLSRAIDAGLIRFLSGHTEPTTDVAISADGARLVSGSRDWTARLWNPNTGAFLRSFGGHNNTVSSVAISPDGAVVATGTVYNDRRLRIWDAETGALLNNYGVDTGTGVGRMMFTPDGEQLICMRNDGTLMAIRNPTLPGVGDVNGDGEIDVEDAAALAGVLVDLPNSPGDVGRADLNGDGERDGRDVGRFVEILMEP